ncbi:EAL domain-containing protein [Roseateles sp. P5_E4]
MNSPHQDAVAPPLRFASGGFGRHFDLWRRRLAPTAPLTMAAAYAAFGLAWILLSDGLLEKLAPDIATLSAVGQGKGIAFVLATSALIYVITPSRQAEGEATGPARQGGPVSVLWVFALLSAAIVLASLMGYARSTHMSHEQQVAQLRREAELKAEIVQGWIERRTEDARRLATDPQLRISLLRWRRSPDEASAAEMRKELLLLLTSTHYADALLFDEHARLLLAPDGAARHVDAAMSHGVRSALQGGRVSGGDFRAEVGDPASLQFDLFVPLPSADGRPGTVLLLRTAPRLTLLPQLTPGSASDAPETLFFRPAARDLLALRIDGSDTPFVPPRNSSRAALTALSGDPSLAGSLMDGLDRGEVAQAAVAARIRNSGWYVAIQAPRDALLGGSIADATTLALVNLLAVLAAGAFTYAALKRRELLAAARMAVASQDEERAWKIAEAIANCSTDVIFAKDLEGRYLFVNRALCRALGRSSEQLIGFDSTGLFPAEQVRQLLKDDAAALRADKPVCVQTCLTMPDGDRLYACTKGKLVDDEGRTLGIYSVSSDITERHDMQQRMRQWATVFEDIRDGVIITDSRGRIQSINHSFTTITGYNAQEAIGASLKLLKSGRHDAEFYQRMWAALDASGHWQGEIWNRRKGGEVYPEWLTISAVRDDDAAVTHYVGVFTDISRLKHSEAQTDWLVHNDPLTRLPNRVQLQRRLEDALARSHRRESRAALLVIDLDGFKTVNDGLGHPAGDELLVCVAARLQARLRHEDFLGRLGGDEFLVILEANMDSTSVAVLARGLLATIAAPMALSCGQDAYLTASIGISMFPDEGNPTAVELLRDADAAMNRAKELGRNQFCFYTDDMNAEARTKLDLEAALSRAIERDELLLHYQPKVDASSGEVVGAEALLRWQRSGIGLVPPSQFIPVAEQSSLILAIGCWVIDAACRQIRAWMDAGQPVVRIAVNVAARQFAAGDLDQVVARALQRHQVDAQWLEIEITEGMLITEPSAAIGMLKRIKALGVKLSLDDFGTGYSSLAYLQQFPIDSLKIDQSFTRRIGEQPDGAALVDAVIALAHRLHLRVVAEGVETAQQRDYLCQRGCDEMQGYHFGRPAPAEALQHLLANGAIAVSAP